MIADALKVGLAIGVIMAFTARALARILLNDAAARANRAAENLRQAMYGYAPERVTARPRSSIILPPGVRTREREGTLPVMDTSWADATADERAAAVLAVLPTHYDDSNGVTARDVAHRLGLKRGAQVSPVLGRMRDAGTAQAGWDKANRRRRVYWRSAA